MTSGSFRALAVVLIAAVSSVDGQQPRDVRQFSAGTGVIAGVVVDEQEGRPLRRARVRLSAAELQAPRTGITGDDGRFQFDGLANGGYLVSAAKDGYVSMAFGASASERPGRRVYPNDTPAGHLVVRLPRGSVITGTVTSPDGEPARNITVMSLASRFNPTIGERRYEPVQRLRVTTDDRGIYRIFGLPAGSYLVAAVPIRSASEQDVQVLSDAEIREALADVRAARTSARPGMPPPLRARPPSGSRGPSLNLAPVFYPGTPMQERAIPVTVGAGEERGGVNLDLAYVPLVTVGGTVAVPPGLRGSVQITDADQTGLIQTVRMVTRPGPNGEFAFRRVPPGTYTISARAVPATRANPAETGYWAETQVTVAGEDFEGVSLTLREALAVSGAVRFSPETRAPDIGLARVALNAFVAGRGSGWNPPDLLVEGHRFSISGLVPGVYRFPSPPRGIRAPIAGWWLTSLQLNGREALDAELQIRESVEDAVVVFSDRASSLSGVVTDAEGTPLADKVVVVFSADARHWFHQSRRVAGVPLSVSGRYLVQNLPPGEYRVAVADDLLPNEWFDPEVLTRLRQASVTITMEQDETKVLNLASPR